MFKDLNNKINDFFGFPTEEFEYDKKDRQLIFFSGILFLALTFFAAYDVIYYYKIHRRSDFTGSVILVFTFMYFTLYSFIGFIRLSIKQSKVNVFEKDAMDN